MDKRMANSMERHTELEQELEPVPLEQEPPKLVKQLQQKNPKKQKLAIRS